MRHVPSRVVVPALCFGANAVCVVWLIDVTDARLADLLVLAVVGFVSGVWLSRSCRS